jgi:hypothetical protein
MKRAYVMPTATASARHFLFLGVAHRFASQR